jgi:hypothetical protein
MSLQYFRYIIGAILIFAFAGRGTIASAQPAYLDSMLIVRVIYDKPNVKALCGNLGMTPLFEGNGKFCDYVINKEQIIQIVESGLKFEIISKKTLFPSSITNIAVDSFYHTYAEMENQLISRMAAYTEIAKVETIGFSQQEQRAIYAFKISDNVGIDEDEAVVYFDGVHHACEVMGLEICLALIDTLLLNYESDSTIANLINNTEIWLVPLVNPDGHYAVMNDISHYYRKNGRDLNNNGILYEYSCNDWWTCPTEGIDLNRNYDWHWEEGGQTEPTSYYYRGAYAGSESENQAITRLLTRIKPQLSVTYHSYGEIIFYPWDLNGRQAPDHYTLYAIAYGLAQRIQKESGNQNYDISPTDGLTGMAGNWQYGRLGALSFTIETIRYYDFLVPFERYNRIVRENLEGCFYLLQRAQGPQITGRIFAPDSLTPIKAEYRLLEHYSTDVDPRYSDSLYGRYRIIVQPGTYSIQIISDRYAPKTINNIVVGSTGPVYKDIILAPFLAGDINGSGEITAADVTYLANYLKGLGAAPLPYWAGDTNGDCRIRPADLTYLVVYLKGGPAPVAGDCQ